MGQYIHVNSFTLWKSKTYRIYSLVIIPKKTALKIISTKKFNLLNNMVLGTVTDKVLLKAL